MLQSSPPSPWVRGLVVHHSDSPARYTAADIEEWHIERGFSGIGYHYVIQKSGEDWIVVHGRNESLHGAHAKYHGQSWNQTTLGICLVGDFSQSPVPPAQWAVLMGLLTALCDRYQLGADSVHMHYETQPEGYTECPGLLFPRAQLRPELEIRLSEFVIDQYVNAKLGTRDEGLI